MLHEERSQDGSMDEKRWKMERRKEEEGGEKLIPIWDIACRMTNITSNYKREIFGFAL